MSRPKKYPEELIARGVRLALESGRPIAPIAKDLGMHPETLRRHVRLAQAAAAGGNAPSSEEREEVRKLRREVFELRRANEILKAASLFFARELDPDRPK
jgi:transposase